MLCGNRAFAMLYSFQQKVTGKRHSRRPRRADLLIPNKNDFVCLDEELRLPGAINKGSATMGSAVGRKPLITHSPNSFLFHPL